MSQLDLAGAAQDLDQLTRRLTPIWQQPRMEQAIRLLHRNPQLAGEVELFILSHSGVTTLDQPLDWIPAPVAGSEPSAA